MDRLSGGSLPIHAQSVQPQPQNKPAGKRELANKAGVVLFDLGVAGFATAVSFGAVSIARQALVGGLIKAINTNLPPGQKVKYGDPGYHALEALCHGVFAYGGTALVGALNGTGNLMGALARHVLGIRRITNPKSVALGDLFMLTFGAAAGIRTGRSTFSLIKDVRQAHKLNPIVALSAYNSPGAMASTIATVTALAGSFVYVRRRDGELTLTDQNLNVTPQNARRIIIGRIEAGQQQGRTGRVGLPLPILQGFAPLLTAAMEDAGMEPSTIAVIAGTLQSVIFVELLNTWNVGTRGATLLADIDGQLKQPNIDKLTQDRLMSERQAALAARLTHWDPKSSLLNAFADSVRNATTVAVVGLCAVGATSAPIGMTDDQLAGTTRASWGAQAMAFSGAAFAMLAVQRGMEWLVKDGGIEHKPVPAVPNGQPNVMPGGDLRTDVGDSRKTGVGVGTAIVGGGIVALSANAFGLALPALLGAAVYCALMKVSPHTEKPTETQETKQGYGLGVAPNEGPPLGEPVGRVRHDWAPIGVSGPFKQAAYYFRVLCGGSETARKESLTQEKRAIPVPEVADIEQQREASAMEEESVNGGDGKEPVYTVVHTPRRPESKFVSPSQDETEMAAIQSSSSSSSSSTSTSS